MTKIAVNIKPFLHLLFWSALFVVPLYIMSHNANVDENSYINFLIRAAILLTLFYINYLYLIDRFLFNKRFGVYFGLNIVLVIALVVIQSFSFDIFTQPPPPSNDGLHRPPPIGFFKFWDFLMIVLTIGMSMAIKMTMRWSRDSINYEKMKSTQIEAEMQNLRSQLNPHFLFNTLNNIYSLIAFDQNKAQESVHRLSGLLRYVLYDNGEQFVPIDKELEFTKNYIELMTLRVPQNVTLRVSIEDNDSRVVIAPLMFITLIENAFKHGIGNQNDCFIDIKITANTSQGILCTVKNSLPDASPSIETKGSGIRLVNLTKRLELLYPGRYEFVAMRQSECFYSMLRIDNIKES